MVAGALPDILLLSHCTASNLIRKSFLSASKQSHIFVELYIRGGGAIFPKVLFDNWHTHAFLIDEETRSYHSIVPETQYN